MSGVKNFLLCVALFIKSIWLLTFKLCVAQKKAQEQKRKEQDELREIFKPITQKLSAGRAPTFTKVANRGFMLRIV